MKYMIFHIATTQTPTYSFRHGVVHTGMKI